VVAENVRALAERSSAATKRLRTCVARPPGTGEAAKWRRATRVTGGSAEAGTSLRSIIAVVEESSQQMRQIVENVEGFPEAAAQIVSSRRASAVRPRPARERGGRRRALEAFVPRSFRRATSEETSSPAEQVAAATEGSAHPRSRGDGHAHDGPANELKRIVAVPLGTAHPRCGGGRPPPAPAIGVPPARVAGPGTARTAHRPRLRRCAKTST
jgi:methyl-accepting chemotaxis protein